MIRALQIPGIMVQGGVESVLMEWYKNINRKEIQFDFLVARQEYASIDDEIIRLGGRVIFSKTIHEVGYLRYIQYLLEIIKAHGPYDVVHIHSVHMVFFALVASWLARIPIRVYHAHNTVNKALESVKLKSLVECAATGVVNKLATVKLACGHDAGCFVYRSSDFKVINNAINTKRFFPYSKSEKDLVRKRFGVDESVIVLGTIGRLVSEKNQEMLVNIVAAAKENGIPLLGVIVGDGPLENKLTQYAKSKGCLEQILFLGKRSDVEDLYNLFDVFCLTSIYEGLPVTAIEAQACGIPCILSDNISNEVNLNVVPLLRLSLADSANHWVQKIVHLAKKKIYTSTELYDKLFLQGYTIDSIIETIEKIYIPNK